MEAIQFTEAERIWSETTLELGTIAKSLMGNQEEVTAGNFIGTQLVENPNFDQNIPGDSSPVLGNELVQNGSFEEIGTDLVTNGDFSDGLNGWSSLNASLNLGGAEINNVGLSNANAYVQQSNLGVVGDSYRLTYDVLETNGKNLVLEQDASDKLLDTSTVGDNKVIYFTWTRTSPTLTIKRQSAETNVTIDNIRLQQLDPNDDWVLLGDTSINYDSINVEGLGWLGTTANNWSARQINIFTVGKTYEVKFRAKQVYGSGNFLVGQAYQVGFTQAISSSFEDYSFNVTASTYPSNYDITR